MSSTRRGRGPEDYGPFLALGALSLLLVVVVGLWAAMKLAAAVGAGPVPPGNPFQTVIELATGQRAWPGSTASVFAVGELLATLGLAGAGTAVVARARRGRSRVDTAARHLATRKDLAHLTAAGAAATARRLGVTAEAPGVLIGQAILAGGSRAALYGSYEDVHIDIWGPRAGKTTARAIPAILNAPGAIVVTSNKRDIVDATRLPREDKGPVWVFDPQGLIGEEPTWWWNPLSYITTATDRIDKAARLAALFSDYSRPPGAKQDAYFDPEGEALLGFLFLAAAEASAPITTVYRWLTDPTDATPVQALREAGHELPAEGVQGVINMPDKQRSGVYGTAKKAVSCLVNPQITRWVTPARNEHRPAFDPAAFVAGTGTLYSVSQEGRAVAGPLVAALTVATVEAAEDLAKVSPGGRLAVPMLAVLDEAANVCRWRQLPDLYSHYGSRGIPLMTILQSWSQGVEVWGEHGMKKLWSAANIRVYGGGVAETGFLGDLSQLVGEYEAPTTSTSTQSGGPEALARNRSISSATRPEKILDVADLSAMPRGRALVFASGARPVLIETLPWQTGPHAQAVRASLARYAPATELPKHELAPTTDPESVR